MNPNFQQATDAANRFTAYAIALVATEIIIIISFFALWVIALVHCIKRKHDSDRLMWVLLICFTGPLGAILYLAMGRPKPPAVTPQPTAMHKGPPPLNTGSGASTQSSSQAPFDHVAMQDEKKRTQAIIDALGAASASKRRP